MRATLLFAVGVILFVGAVGYGAGDKDFYSDGVIEDGDEYWNVGVYDTPPEHTTVDMTGGWVDSMATFDESTVNISGGEVWSIYAAEYSTVNVLGGSVLGLESWDNSLVHILNGAEVDGSRVRGSGTLNMTGGTVDHLGAIESGTINLYGGTILDRLYVTDPGTVYVFGYDLVKTPSGGTYGYGQVYGFWSNGLGFLINLNGEDTYTRVNLIPEPGTLLLFGVASLFVRRRWLGAAPRNTRSQSN